MRKLFAILLVPALAGCLSPIKTPTVAEWSVGLDTLANRVETPKYGVTRLSQVLVRAPYDTRNMVVLRSDSSYAFDPYNHFAAVPSQLLKGVVEDSLASSGLFKTVVPSASAASASHLVEVTVTDLRLDCSASTAEEASQVAEVGLSLLVLDRAREIVGKSRGSGRAQVVDGDFGSAFSKALAKAVDAAVETL